MPSPTSHQSGGLKIGEAAKQLGVTTRTLRFYQEAGLIAPARSDGGTRRFDAADLARLSAIMRLTEQGTPIQEIQRLAAIRSTSPTGAEASRTVAQTALAWEEALNNRIARLQEMVAILALAREQAALCFNCDDPPTPAVCHTCPSAPTFTGPDASELFRIIWEKQGIADKSSSTR